MTDLPAERTGELPVAAADAAAQRRCDVLAAACAFGTASILLFGYLQGAALAVATEELAVDFGAAPSGWELVEAAAGFGAFGATTSYLGPAGLALLVLAYLLVAVVGPGRWVTGLGARVLQAVLALGPLTVLGSVVATVGVARRGGMYVGFSLTGADGERDVTLTVLDRLSVALPIVACGVGAVVVTWCAWSALAEDPDPPTVGDDPAPPPGPASAGRPGRGGVDPYAMPVAPPVAEDPAVWAPSPPEG